MTEQLSENDHSVTYLLILDMKHSEASMSSILTRITFYLVCMMENADIPTLKKHENSCFESFMPTSPQLGPAAAAIL